MKDEKLTEQIISKKRLFTGKIVNVETWQVALPNGNKATREAVLHSGGVSAFVLLNNGTVPLVRQHRVVAGQVLWELPAGKREPGEDPLEAMKRELEEETGLRAAHWQPMTSFYPTPAYCSEVIHLFYGEDTVETAQKLDEDEFLELAFFTQEQLKDMVFSGAVQDGKTIIGILMGLHIAQERKTK